MRTSSTGKQYVNEKTKTNENYRWENSSQDRNPRREIRSMQRERASVGKASSSRPLSACSDNDRSEFQPPPKGGFPLSLLPISVLLLSEWSLADVPWLYLSRSWKNAESPCSTSVRACGVVSASPIRKSTTSIKKTNAPCVSVNMKENTLYLFSSLQREQERELKSKKCPKFVCHGNRIRLRRLLQYSTGNCVQREYSCASRQEFATPWNAFIICG